MSGPTSPAAHAAVAELFDADFYLASNPDVAAAGVDPLGHFLASGWRELRKPRRDFDVWWYWATHLDPSDTSTNPFVHYALTGRSQELTGRPDPLRSGPGAGLPSERPIRRAILFAAFDADGVVDEATVHYVRELSRHGDVFYLADCFIAPAELARLDDVAVGAWASRHGAYDVGSYAMLARDLVGWERLEEYDEVLFVNDSCYLIRPLDDVFARMDADACDWWGLQATKGLASTYAADPLSHHAEPVALEPELLARFEDSPSYDFHVGSYFLAFRSPVIADPVFRRLIDSIGPQPSKLLVILKYEIGLTHLLLGRGHRLSTYVPELYPFHPLFTDWAFTLIERGFPLLKQYLLEHNHYDTPGLARWKERVLATVPEAPVELFEARLRRTAADDRLVRSFAVGRRKDGTVTAPRLLSAEQFHQRDADTRKDRRTWTFVVDPQTHRLSDSALAMLEAALRRPHQRAVVLTRSVPFDPAVYGGAARKVSTAPLHSPDGQQALLRAGTVLVSADPWKSTGLALDTTARTVVRLRDGHTVPDPATAPANPAHAQPDRRVTGFVTASDVDLLLALPAVWPAAYDDAWRTGLPAHDLLGCAEGDLPAPTRDQERLLRDELAGRRLILIAPDSDDTVRISAREADLLATLAAAADAVIGIRTRASDLDRPYARLFAGSAIDLSARRYPSRTAVLRAADVVLTDDWGLALDLLVAERACLLLGRRASEELAPSMAALLGGTPHLDLDPDGGTLVAALSNTTLPADASTARLRRVLSTSCGSTDGSATARTLAMLDRQVAAR